MMQQFNAHDIEWWAELSGDRNPIHFDREAALQIGTADVVVHGMLTLLQIKQRLGRVTTPLPERWVQFKALLKIPVLRDAKSSLSTSDRSNYTAFKLLPEVGVGEHVIGNMRMVEAPEWSSSTPSFTLPADEVVSWLKKFRQGLGHGLDDWIALDALIFTDLIRNQIGVVFDRLSPALRLDQQLLKIEDISTHLLVQTTHQVTFYNSAQLLNPQNDCAQDIRYQIDNIELIESVDKAVGTLDLGVHVQNCHVMTISLGLMVKKLQTNRGAIQ